MIRSTLSLAKKGRAFMKFNFRLLLGFLTAALILAACLQPETPERSSITRSSS
jgi:hypothetical protein